MDIYKRKCDEDIERLQAEIDEERKARIKAENEAVDLLAESFVIFDLKAEIDELVDMLESMTDDAEYYASYVSKYLFDKQGVKDKLKASRELIKKHKGE